MRFKPAKRRGAAVVEFAIIGPLVLFLVFAIMEIGRYTMMRNQLENAVREGARVAACRTHDKTTADINTIVVNYMKLYNVQLSSYNVEIFKADPATANPLDANDNVVAVASAPFNNAKFGQGVAVRVSGTYKTIFGGIGALGKVFPTTMNIQAISIMYSEGN